MIYFLKYQRYYRTEIIKVFKFHIGKLTILIAGTQVNQKERKPFVVSI